MCMVRCIIVFNRQAGWRDCCHMYTYVFAMPSVDTCTATCALYTCKHVYHVPEQACLGASHTGPLDGLTLGHQLATHLSHTYMARVCHVAPMVHRICIEPTRAPCEVCGSLCVLEWCAHVYTWRALTWPIDIP